MSFSSKFKTYISSIVRQQVTSDQLALIILVAFILTSFPILGITTILATSIGVKYKINLPVLIFITYMLEPVRFFMFMPLAEIGALILDVPNFEISIDTLKYSFSNGIDGFLAFLTNQLLYAFLGWLVVSVFVSLPVYFLLKKLLKFLFIKYQYKFSFKNV